MIAFGALALLMGASGGPAREPADERAPLEPRPGDTRPLERVHPTLRLTAHAEPGVELPLASLCAAPSGDDVLAVDASGAAWLVGEGGARSWKAAAPPCTRDLRVEGGWLLRREGAGTTRLLRVPPGTPGAALQLASGPFAGEAVYGDLASGELFRASWREGAEGAQGAVMRFAGGLSAKGLEHLAESVDGALWTGALERLDPVGGTAFEIRSVQAFSNGLEIAFSEPLAVGSLPGPDDVWLERVAPGGTAEELAVDEVGTYEGANRVFLRVLGLGEGDFLRVRLLPGGFEGESAGAPFSTEAWVTIGVLPEAPRELPPERQRPAPNTLSEAERAARWRLLFDGSSTSGWRTFRGGSPPVGWEVAGDALVRTAPGGDIVSEDTFADFELALEWRVAPGGNSGIFFRVGEDHDAPWKTGPEMQVLDNRRHADGRSGLTSAGANYGLHAPAHDDSRPAGRWNRARIVARGPDVEHWLNGALQCRYTIESADWRARVAAGKFAVLPDYGRRARGHIALQDHGDPVEYRNIRIRPLSED